MIGELNGAIRCSRAVRFPETVRVGRRSAAPERGNDAARMGEKIPGEAKMSDQAKPACVSRRTTLIAAAGATALMTLNGSAEAKMAQSAVKYQPTPKDGKQCSGCNLFIAPNSCKSVAGDIAPTGWCSIWVKKA
jgi:hypothetical protein